MGQRLYITDIPWLLLEYSSKNPLPANEVIAGTGKKLWWDCQVEKCKHQWEATGNARVGSKKFPGTGCPACAGKVATKNNSLEALFPDLAKEYSSENPKLASEITASSQKRVKWDCSDCSYRWKTSVKNRTKNKSGCPGCAGKAATKKNNLTVTHPHLFKEYSYRNDKPAFKIIAGTHKILEWDCSKPGCMNEWQATGLSRKIGGVCPACKGEGVTATNNLEYCYPKIAVEFSKLKSNLTAKDVVAKTNKKFWWEYLECGHLCLETIKDHLNKGCPVCLKETKIAVFKEPQSLAQAYPHLVAEYSPQNDVPADELFNFKNKIILWQCLKGHNNWQAYVYARAEGDIGCPECYLQTQKFKR